MLHRFMYLLYVAYKPAETNVAILFLQCTCSHAVYMYVPVAVQG